MIRIPTALVLALVSVTPLAAADLSRPAPMGRFRATCEDLGKLCFAQACGRDQIDAAMGCRARCPSAVVMSVVPVSCPLVRAPKEVILHRRG